MISNERLDTLIAETAHTAQTWKDFDAEMSAKNPEYESIVQSKCDDLLSALEELRDIRQAATAGVEEAAKRIAEKSVPFLITDKGKQDGYPLAGIDIGRYAEAISAELTALLAERDTVLRECRDDAACIQDSLGETPVKYRSAAKRITDRIDALTKGGVDGT